MYSCFLIAGVLAAGPIEFDADVLPIFTKAGCNSAACHGAAAGRGGFALSLYGSRPAADYDAIVRQRQGRRINFRHPATSLLLAKPTGALDHGGDVRLDAAGVHARTMEQWILSGARRGESPALVRLEVTPADAWHESLPAKTQLVPMAVFDDGSRRDVRDLAVYSAADESAAAISDSGEVTLLRRGRQIITVRFASEVSAVTITAPLSEEQIDLAQSPRRNFIDDEICAALERLRLPPSPAADDAAFLRRARLDLTGRLPSPEEVEAFLADTDDEKRPTLVDRLLASPDFTEYWTHRLATWLRIGAAGADAIAAQAFYDWVRQCVAEGVPLDEMARALVTGDGDTHSVGPANFYRAAGDARGQAEYFSEVLLGVRLRCANCHNHPLDRWTQDDYHGLAAMFAKLQRGRTIRFAGRGDVSHPATGEAAVPQIPGEKLLSVDGDHRRELAQWLTAKENPYFARAMANRLWSAMMGRGLVEPVDDFRATNPATHPALLQKLADDFASHGYDLRHTLRTIARSAAYARSSRPLPANKADDRYYSRALQKPLSPEVRFDAISDVTGPDASGGGRAARAINYLDLEPPAREVLEELGRCDRATSCEVGQATASGLTTWLALLNGRWLNQRLMEDRGRVPQLAEMSDDKLIMQCYLLAFSRRPTAAEMAFWRSELASADRESRRAAIADFVWSLINCHEFVNCY